MRREDVTVGIGVTYRPHPGAAAEDGLVTELRDGGAMVRYSALGPAKLTPYAMLAPLHRAPDTRPGGCHHGGDPSPGVCQCGTVIDGGERP